MDQNHPAKNRFLADQGLNLQAVFYISDLPTFIVELLQAQLPDLDDYQQLILFAHGGKSLWRAFIPSLLLQQQLDNTTSVNAHPLDTYSTRIVSQYMHSELPLSRFRIIYPGSTPLPIQQLGELAGWHHPSPMRIGINTRWGSWFAYRVIVLSNTRLETTEPVCSQSPCDNCIDKVCISACPSGALDEGDFKLDQCISYRKKPVSPCALTCPARTSCPIGSEHRYYKEQLSFHYSHSLLSIKNHK